MDPLSIAAAAASLSAFAFKASKEIYSCIDDIRSADATLLQLQNEVNALQTGLQNVASTFQSDTVVEFCKSTAGSLDQLQSTRLLNNVKPLLNDCQATLEKLETILAGIEGISGRMRNLFGKPIKAFKINIRSKDVELIRHEIRSYSSAMQMTLHMVGICLTIDGNKQAETTSVGIEEKLSGLAAQITDVQKRISENDNVQNYEGETLVTDEMESQKHASNLRTHIQAARELFTNGSVYAGTVAGTVIGDDKNDTEINRVTRDFGSLMGMDEHRRRQINDWRAEDPVPEAEEEEDSDDGDADEDMFRARLALARKKLAAKDYKSAETQFFTCLHDYSLVNNLPPHDLVDLRLEYSLACQGSGNFLGEQKALKDLLRSNLPKAQMLHLQHRLATSHFREGALPAARKIASEVMKGRRKLLGAQDQPYLETVNLLVDICKVQNDMDDVEMYESLLPDNFAAEKGVDPIDSSENATAIKLLSKRGYSLGDKRTLFEALSWASTESWASNESYAKKEWLAVIRLLLQQGPDLQGVNTNGQTMLMFAARHGLDDIVEKLIKDGADISAKDKRGNTALHEAADMGHLGAVQVLLNHGLSVSVAQNDGVQPIHDAAMSGRDAVVNLLLDRGADPNAPGRMGYGPLFEAVNSDHISTVRLLLDRGADANAGSDSNYTPLMAVAYTSRPEPIHIAIVQLLLERGAKVSLKDQYGNSAIGNAKKMDNKDMIKLLKAAKPGLFGKK